jgi:hypothetical protein
MNPQVRVAVKRPIPVEFMVWPGGAENATPIIDWVLSHDGTARYDSANVVPEGWPNAGEVIPEHLEIDTLEGTMRASAGDVIIRGAKGEFYPCKPDIFRDTYDIIETPEENQQ